MKIIYGTLENSKKKEHMWNYILLFLEQVYGIWQGTLEKNNNLPQISTTILYTKMMNEEMRL